MSTTKTLWTVAAGSTAAVLIPGVAFAVTAGGPIKEAQQSVEETSVVQEAEKPAGQTANLSAPSAADEADGTSGGAGDVPPVEQMMTANSAVSAQSAPSPVSAQSAPSPVSAQSAPSPVSAQSAPSPISAPSAPSPASADSPQSPGSAD